MSIYTDDRPIQRVKPDWVKPDWDPITFAIDEDVIRIGTIVAEHCHRRAIDKGAAQPKGEHPRGDMTGKMEGFICEVAARMLFGLPRGDDDLAEVIGCFTARADLGGNRSVRGTTWWRGHLILDDQDLDRPDDDFYLFHWDTGGQCAFLGWVPFIDGWAVREWATWGEFGRRPNWVVAQHQLRDPRTSPTPIRLLTPAQRARKQHQPTPGNHRPVTDQQLRDIARAFD